MITRLVTDVDGVLTDGMHYYTAEGKTMKAFASHDSDAIKIFRKMGIEVSAISADHRGFAISQKRLENLGVDLVLVREDERLSWFTSNCNASETAFVGDGLWDVPVMQAAAVSFSPSDAVNEARDAATYVVDTPGGRGVLLDVLRRFARYIEPYNSANGVSLTSYHPHRIILNVSALSSLR